MAINKTDEKKILSGKPLRLKIKQGINNSCDIIKSTLGPYGKNVSIERHNYMPLITNDGVTIARNIVLEDEFENMGADLVNKMSQNTDEVGGDGTTTACVILNALINKIFKDEDSTNTELDKFLDTKISIKTKKEIMESMDKIKTRLSEMSTPINTREDIKRVAFVSSESEEISEIVADLFFKLGKDGQVLVENSNSFNIQSEIISGYQVSSGIPALQFANTSSGFCEIHNPIIIATNEKIESINQLDKIMTEFTQSKKSGNSSIGSDIVIFCEGITTEMLGVCVVLKSRIGLNIVPIKVPEYKKGDVFEDICATTGATLIDISKKETVANVGYDADIFGNCDEILIRRKDTIIKNGAGSTEDLISKIKKEMEDNKELTPHLITKMKERISLISSGIGIIRVGALTKSDQEYLKLKVDDTVNATKAALDGGVVPGGGMALKTIDESLDENDILKGVLSEPYKQIILNSDGELSSISDEIVDPVKITQNSLEKACSLAGLVLTIESGIAIKRKDPKNDDDIEEDVI